MLPSLSRKMTDAPNGSALSDMCANEADGRRELEVRAGRCAGGAAGGQLQSTRRRSSSGEDEAASRCMCTKSILQQAAGASRGG